MIMFSHGFGHDFMALLSLVAISLKKVQLTSVCNMPKDLSGDCNFLPCLCTVLHLLKVRTCDAMQAERSRDTERSSLHIGMPR